MGAETISGIGNNRDNNIMSGRTVPAAEEETRPGTNVNLGEIEEALEKTGRKSDDISNQEDVYLAATTPGTREDATEVGDHGAHGGRKVANNIGRVQDNVSQLEEDDAQELANPDAGDSRNGADSDTAVSASCEGGRGGEGGGTAQGIPRRVCRSTRMEHMKAMLLIAALVWLIVYC
ncbi:hypothetical protein BDZ91DRAFT_731926 [Kalaharituber pfeilii]|nr:hypothetical protein BDZ91DRAFT_731926 [Kalaharituber pfeilii]